MSVVIRQCLSDPPRLKSGQFLFLKKIVDDLSSGLVALPEFLPFLPDYLTAEQRLSFAAEALYALKLVDKQGLSSRSMNLVITPNGHHWLNDSNENKLKAVLAALRNKRDIHVRYIEVFSFFPRTVTVHSRRAVFDYKEGLITHFNRLKLDEWVSFNTFVESTNPFNELISAHGIRALSINNVALFSESEAYSHWQSIVVDFLFQRLAALGAVEFGVDDCGSYSFRIKQGGAFLFGMSDSFSLDAENECVLLVQPDFDIVFLSPQPSVEAQCAPFCERLSSGIGTLFKLTRESVLLSVGQEYTFERVIELLERFSLQSLPDNVTHELKSWFDSARSISIRSTELIVAPDADTARRIVMICEQDVRLLADCYVELLDYSKKQSVLTKLRKQGIILQ